MNLDRAVEKARQDFHKGIRKPITFVEKGDLGLKYNVTVTASNKWFDEETPPPTIIVRRSRHKEHLPLKPLLSRIK